MIIVIRSLLLVLHKRSEGKSVCGSQKSRRDFPLSLLLSYGLYFIIVVSRLNGRTMKKRAFLTLTILLLACLLGTMLFACRPTPSEELSENATTREHKTKVLFLGDSIGEAIAGTTPLTEREAYGYYGILGNINGFEYYNRAVTGHTTEDLLNLVQREDDGINLVHSLICTAEVIHISVIGNDFLYSNHADMILNLQAGDYSMIRSRQTEAKSNIRQTLAILRELNPTAVIILQTLYNPAGEDSPLFTARARNELASRGVAPSGYHALMGQLIDEINSVLIDLHEEEIAAAQAGELTRPFELADVHSAFERVYEQEPERWLRLFCEDGIHTIPEGHALTTQVLQQKLTELGFAAPNALHNYKADKVTQLKRLYPEIEGFDEVRKAIMRASDFAGVNRAYFGATRDLVPSHEVTPAVGKTFALNREFEVTFVTVYGNELTGMVDKKKAHILFDSQGNFEIYLPLREIVTASAKYMIAESGGLNFNRMVSLDLAKYYFGNIAPGVDKSDLQGLLTRIEELYGISVVGIDLQKECVQEMLEYYRQTGVLVVTDPEVLNDDVAFKCAGTYRLQTVKDKDGNELTAIYLNNGIGKSESFLRFTYSEDEFGDQKVRMTIDVIKAELEGMIYEE